MHRTSGTASADYGVHRGRCTEDGAECNEMDPRRGPVLRAGSVLLTPAIDVAVSVNQDADSGRARDGGARQDGE